MLRFTLRQMRASVRNLLAAGLAIMVASGFIAAALAGSDVASQTLKNIVSQQFAQADAVAVMGDISSGPPPPSGAADAARSLPGVADAFQRLEVTGLVSRDGAREWVSVFTLSPNPRFNAWPVDQGTEPTKVNQVKLAASLADRLDVEVGGKLTLTVELYTETITVAIADQPELEDGTDTLEMVGGHTTTASTELQVTGVFDDQGPSFWPRPQILTLTETFQELGIFSAGPFNYYTSDLLLTFDNTTDPKLDADFRHQLAQSLAQNWQADQSLADVCPEPLLVVDSENPDSASHEDRFCSVQVLGVDQATEQAITAFMGEQAGAVTAVALVFGTVSLMVAALVIANTFQVMVAARTRTLALLRAVGASKEQLQHSVVLEAVFTGLLASLAGAIAGWVVIRLAISAAQWLYPAMPIPETLALMPQDVLTCVAVGTGATVLASLVPARLAIRVTPLEALRPQVSPHMSSPGGRKRFIWSMILEVTGGVMMVAAVYMVQHLPAELHGRPVILGGLLVGVTGGVLAGIGVILGAVFWLPRLVAVAAVVARHLGGGARLAAANLVRNPLRTSATATALLIGTTLVSGMLVSAACINRTLDRQIGVIVPVDAQIGTASGSFYTPEELESVDPAATLAENKLPGDLMESIRNLEGVQATATLVNTLVVIPDNTGAPITWDLVGVDPNQLKKAMNIGDLADQMEDGVILVSEWAHQLLNRKGALSEYWYEVGSEEQSSSQKFPDSSMRPVFAHDGKPQNIEFRYVPAMDSIPGVMTLTTQHTVDALGGGAAVSMFVKVDAQADASGVVDDLTNLVNVASEGRADHFAMQGDAVHRAENRKAVDTILLIGLALLAVSVVVALIGVSNALSLSVLERARETALLRALGLTRGQTRWMLATEGITTAGVAGLAGVVLGVAFGWVGTALVLGASSGFALALPVSRLGLVVGLALLVGLAASVLPGRRAANIPPAAVLSPFPSPGVF